ncbi:hypothetical protein AN964_01955 [Heyndrickxia shackletonii]|uniref:HXXEE domain-containing protein n=1 Tax=Heyndrickxia shackletonii TaxID=157838 RepID=A0A0Q3WP35_9BACI|nr:hypothetical protein AN964_01955 [Heyndrickxia shackletonii]RTZ57105.1 HXXEE domain-containing protein [Bacillus sp. SAJ1]
MYIDKLIILLVWLFPIIFAIHDFEEIIVVEKWIAKNKQDLVHKLPKRAKNFFEKNFAMKTDQFSIVVFAEFIIISLATLFVFLNGFTGFYKWFYLGLFAVLFLHSFTHIGQAILLRRYTPGVITSIFFLIPYGLWFYKVVLQKNMISYSDIWISIPVGVILFALFFPALMKAASKY